MKKVVTDIILNYRNNVKKFERQKILRLRFDIMIYIYKMKSVYIKSSIIPLVIPNLLLFILISSEDFLKSRLGITKGIMLDFI